MKLACFASTGKAPLAMPVAELCQEDDKEALFKDKFVWGRACGCEGIEELLRICSCCVIRDIASTVIDLSMCPCMSKHN